MRKTKEDNDSGIISKEDFELVQDAMSRAITSYGVDKISGKKMQKAKELVEEYKEKSDDRIADLEKQVKDLQKVIQKYSGSLDNLDSEDGNILENLDKNSRIDVIFAYGNSPLSNKRILYMGIKAGKSEWLLPLEKDSTKVKKLEDEYTGKLSMTIIMKYRKKICEKLNNYFKGIGRGIETKEDKLKKYNS